MSARTLSPQRPVSDHADPSRVGDIPVVDHDDRAPPRRSVRDGLGRHERSRAARRRRTLRRSRCGRSRASCRRGTAVGTGHIGFLGGCLPLSSARGARRGGRFLDAVAHSCDDPSTAPHALCFSLKARVPAWAFFFCAPRPGSATPCTPIRTVSDRHGGPRRALPYLTALSSLIRPSPSDSCGSCSPLTREHRRHVRAGVGAAQEARVHPNRSPLQALRRRHFVYGRPGNGDRRLRRHDAGGVRPAGAGTSACRDGERDRCDRFRRQRDPRQPQGPSKGIGRPLLLGLEPPL